jgi:hypothetical protein
MSNVVDLKAHREAKVLSVSNGERFIVDKEYYITNIAGHGTYKSTTVTYNSFQPKGTSAFSAYTDSFIFMTIPEEATGFCMVFGITDGTYVFDTEKEAEDAYDVFYQKFKDKFSSPESFLLNTLKSMLETLGDTKLELYTDALEVQYPTYYAQLIADGTLKPKEIKPTEETEFGIGLPESDSNVHQLFKSNVTELSFTIGKEPDKN